MVVSKGLRSYHQCIKSKLKSHINNLIKSEMDKRAEIRTSLPDCQRTFHGPSLPHHFLINFFNVMQ